MLLQENVVKSREGADVSRGLGSVTVTQLICRRNQGLVVMKIIIICNPFHWPISRRLKGTNGAIPAVRSELDSYAHDFITLLNTKI